MYFRMRQKFDVYNFGFCGTLFDKFDLHHVITVTVYSFEFVYSQTGLNKIAGSERVR